MADTQTEIQEEPTGVREDHLATKDVGLGDAGKAVSMIRDFLSSLHFYKTVVVDTPLLVDFVLKSIEDVDSFIKFGLVDGEVAALSLACINRYYFSKQFFAYDQVFYVYPWFRHTRIWLFLGRVSENWARGKGCHDLTLSPISPSILRVAEKHGYEHVANVIRKRL